MDTQRRKFLQVAGTLAAGAFILPACKSTPKAADAEAAVKAIEGIKNFGLQLYTLRDDLPKDPKAVLQQVASFGYKQIESFEGPQGMFWGMTPADYKKFLADLGMRGVSSHCDIFNGDFESKAAQAAEAGLDYLICPWLGPQKTLDEYKQKAERFNQAGEICKKHGIRFAYHNHAYSFPKIDNVVPQDLMMENTDPSLVDFEMDIYWVVAAGEDPEAWMKKYKDRFRLCHVKDRSNTPIEDEGKNSVVVGTGSIDWKKILKTADETGMKYYVVEQEAYEGTTPLEAVKANAEYMKNFSI